MGYGDGYPRSNIGNFVIIGNQKCQIIGNICMNMLTANVSEADCKIGDRVILLGQSQSQKITAHDLARFNNTIPYEITTNFRSQAKNRRFVEP
jgi:alanine racemase